MLGDLHTSVTNISPEQLDALMGDTTPDGSPSADNLILGETKDEPVVKATASTDIPFVNLDDLEDEEDKPADKPADSSATPGEPADAPKEEPKVELDQHKQVLKETVNYLVEKGIFKDFEGREELEMDDETYAELLDAQLDALVEERYQVRKTASGTYGEAIIDYIEKGGDPDRLIDLFKEQKAVQEFDLSTEETQTEFITQYYKNELKWKPERIKRYLNTLLSEEGALEEEATSVKQKYQEAHNQQLQTLRAEQDEADRLQKERVEAFKQSITAAIQDNKAYDAGRKQFLNDALFKFKKTPDGRQVNEFYLKFQEWQSDPKKYIELAEFILDHDNYLRRKEIEINNRVVDKTFKFVKGGAALSKNTGTKHTDPEEKTAYQGTNFSFAFKKK